MVKKWYANISQAQKDRFTNSCHLSQTATPSGGPDPSPRPWVHRAPQAPWQEILCSQKIESGAPKLYPFLEFLRVS